MRAHQQLFSLKGATGIVTGGSTGLGLAIARRLAAAGARVHALSRTGRPQAGGKIRGVTHHALDVTDAAALGAAIKLIGVEDGIDFVVNNAGITVRASFARGQRADWDRIHAVNLTAAAETARLAHPFLRRSRHPGRMVFITSMASHLGFSEVVPYCASKAGVLGLMRGLAVEWADDGILVNAVAPGWFPSAMTRAVMDAGRRKKILARMPLHRFGEPDELAAAVLFLLSPAATYITGHELAVDGGALAYGF
ncbi:MAG TPA: SDR family oxidoreductase [Lacunisphaera sp.]|nr:SDR family oxidoreductase [Lacunisphaera sp.]